jgi:Transposase DDE domain
LWTIEQSMWWTARTAEVPLRALFQLLRGPAATTPAAAAAVRWRGLLVCAVDGTTMIVPDSATNLTRFSKPNCFNGGSGYPMLRLVALVACGTRSIIDAVFGPISGGETRYATAPVGSLRAGILVLADRNFAAGYLLAAIADAHADALIRAKTGRARPRWRCYAATATAPTAPPSAANSSGSSTRRSLSPPPKARPPAYTGW